MKLHSIVLRILITLSLAAVVVLEYNEYRSFQFAAACWGFWAGYFICSVCLFLRYVTPRFFGAGGIAAVMLCNALYSLHAIASFYPRPYPIPKLPYILESALSLFAMAGSLVLLYWEVQQLQKAAEARRTDPEEEEFSRSAGWDEGPKK